MTTDSIQIQVWRQNVTWEMKYWIAYDDRSWYKDLFCLDINMQAAKPSLINLVISVLFMF